MTTEEAIRHGTATTGRLISAAALVLVVVGGAFAFSDLVMMQYLAIGLMTALLLDATVVRMFLVPSVMKLLGNDCWWAPWWMKRLQERIGLGELALSPVQTGQVVHGKQRVRVFLPQDAAADLQRLDVERRGLGELESSFVKFRQVIHRLERVGVRLPQGAAAGFARLDKERLGLGELPLGVVQQRQVVHGGERAKVFLA